MRFQGQRLASVLCLLLILGVLLAGCHAPEVPTEAPTEPAEETLPSLSPEDETYLNAQAHSEKLAVKGDFEGALALLRSKEQLFPQDTRYARLSRVYEAQRKACILRTAQGYAQAGRYRQAIELLDNAWKDYGDKDFFDLAAQHRRTLGQQSGTLMAAGKYNTALIQDGRLQVIGDNEFGELEASGWTNVTSVSVGDRFVMALHSNGQVSFAGHFYAYPPLTDPGWENITAIAAGDTHAVALTRDGTLVSAGHNYSGDDQRDVDTIMRNTAGRRIEALAAGYTHTLALLEDGTVLAGGSNDQGACDVYGWRDVAAISAGSEFSAALMEDGTVRVTGLYADRAQVDRWTDIAAIAAGDYFLIGLKNDGTMVAAALDKENQNHSDEGQLEVYQLRNIVAISAGHNHVLALEENGTLHCLGSKALGACDADGWQLLGYE